jgi:hypothetical protein
MPEEIDWSVTTWEGHRRQQHREYLALSLREKIENLEQLAEVAAAFGQRIAGARGRPKSDSPGADLDATSDDHS